MEEREIGSDERAALIKLYSQYEYDDETYTNPDVATGVHLKNINFKGHQGWRVKDMMWHDDGLTVTFERSYFNYDHALSRAKKH